MNEIIFVIENSEEGGFIAKALGYSIFTESETKEGLKTQILDAVKCHFDAEKLPKIIRLHFVHDELLYLAA